MKSSKYLRVDYIKYKSSDYKINYKDKRPKLEEEANICRKCFSCMNALLLKKKLKAPIDK